MKGEACSGFFGSSRQINFSWPKNIWVNSLSRFAEIFIKFCVDGKMYLDGKMENLML
jgi:hypothetical protein